MAWVEEVEDALGYAEEEAPFERSWQPVDLAKVLDGSWRPPEPTVGARRDGVGMFYPGKLHTVVSETEGGKTWLALAAALDELAAARHVVYLDFEDDEGGVVGRLLALGGEREAISERFHYLRPTQALKSGIHRDDLREVMRLGPSLAIVDGITEAMGVHGLNPLDNADAAAFGRILPRPLAAAGCAVVSLDHVTKDREGRGRYAIGAAHKLNALDGAAYILTNRTPFGVGLTGRSTVHIAKDRPGQLRRHALSAGNGLHWYADLVLTSHTEDFVEATLEVPSERDDAFRPTLLMARAAAVVAERGPLPKRLIIAGTQGKNTAVSHAVDCLILDGYLSGATPHQLLKPYEETP